MTLELHRSTDRFRQEHTDITTELERASDMVESLAVASKNDQRETVSEIVEIFTRRIAPHSELEEQVLYPVIDRHAGMGKFPFTSTMRHEHVIINRWIRELEELSKLPDVDVRVFSRRADQLLGLIYAHFEDEEEVLLQVLDVTMTSEEFEWEILAKIRRYDH